MASPTSNASAAVAALTQPALVAAGASVAGSLSVSTPPAVISSPSSSPPDTQKLSPAAGGSGGASPSSTTAGAASSSPSSSPLGVSPDGIIAIIVVLIVLGLVLLCAMLGAFFARVRRNRVRTVLDKAGLNGLGAKVSPRTRLTAMLGETTAAATHGSSAGSSPRSSETITPRGQKLMRLLDSRTKQLEQPNTPADGDAAPSASRTEELRRDAVMRALASADVPTRRERRVEVINEAALSSADVLTPRPPARFAGLLGSDDDEESPRVRPSAASSSWQEADAHHAAPASVTVLPK